MIVVSAGMQKSGSAYIYNIINDLLISSGNGDARAIKEKHHLSGIMKWGNNNVGSLDRKTLLKLLFVSFKEKTYAVKTHEGPSRTLGLLMKLGMAKTIYIYRDPRDVLLSAIDHGKKIKAKGEHHTFAKMVDFYDAFEHVKKWVHIFKQYKQNSKVLCVKYEDLMDAPLEITDQICSYLKISVDKDQKMKILDKYDRKNPKADLRGLHFNKAKVNRFKEELSEEKVNFFKKELGEDLAIMGYQG